MIQLEFDKSIVLLWWARFDLKGCMIVVIPP